MGTSWVVENGLLTLLNSDSHFQTRATLKRFLDSMLQKCGKARSLLKELREKYASCASTAQKLHSTTQPSNVWVAVKPIKYIYQEQNCLVSFWHKPQKDIIYIYRGRSCWTIWVHMRRGCFNESKACFFLVPLTSSSSQWSACWPGTRIFCRGLWAKWMLNMTPCTISWQMVSSQTLQTSFLSTLIFLGSHIYI